MRRVVWLMLVVTTLSARAEPNTRTRRTLYGDQCPSGCASCSTANGCVTCKPRHFLFLRRVHMRQTGICVLSCPLGHYGVKRTYNVCAKCKIKNCQVCLNKYFCLQCAENFVEFRGKCVEQCVKGVAGNSSRPCLSKVDCIVGEWSGWGICSKRGKTCGYKYGIQTRMRETIQRPSATGEQCPETTENRRCKMLDRTCPVVISNDSEYTDIELKSSNKPTKRDKRKERKKKKRKNRKQSRNRRHNSTEMGHRLQELLI